MRFGSFLRSTSVSTSLLQLRRRWPHNPATAPSYLRVRYYRRNGDHSSSILNGANCSLKSSQRLWQLKVHGASDKERECTILFRLRTGAAEGPWGY